MQSKEISFPQTMLPLYLIIFLCVAIGIVFYYKSLFNYWKKKGVPYLKPTLPFGNATKFFLNQQCIGELFMDVYLQMRRRGWKHGGMFFCGKPVYIPLDNEIVKKILVSDFINFPNHGLYIDESVDPLSVHLFNMEGYRWKNVRAKLPLAFTAAKMRRNVIIMNETCKEFLKIIDKYESENKSINIKDVLTRFSIDVVSACILGMESNTLKNQNPELLRESRAFFDNQWSRVSNTLVILIPRPVLSKLNFKLFTKSATKYFLNMFKMIKEHRQTETTKRNDLTDLLLDLADKNKSHPDFNGVGTMEPLNFNEFAAQLYIFFQAGFETSSSTQAFALYELASNQTIQDKLRLEINEVLKKHNGQFTYDSVNDMDYLGRVIDETLRKYPIFPVLPRAATADYQVPGTDVIIEKNSFVLVTNLGVHYDPEYYPDPMKFDPDRFTAENKAKRPYCSYIPFGEGPRICIGKRFGIWQSKIGLANIIKNYNVTLSKKMKLPARFDTSGLILKLHGDIWVDLKRIC
ncbi:cytochrome P450 6a2-like isoform X1 [Rhynchophorus ferrugineus]|uniref:cytochrome P450 6a2-like isoform X1 n=1 Tax=Rhynchophorus ferrugineus TaxID=354439 RepID=UPI003FCD12E2